MNEKRLSIAISISAIFAAVLPPLLYWLFIGRIPNMDPIAASDYLLSERGDAALVDVRDPAEFRVAHLESTINLPLTQISSLVSISDLPSSLNGKSLLLICNGGVASAEATKKLRALGVSKAWNITGGLQSWIAAAKAPGYPAITTLYLETGESSPLPYKQSPVAEQVTAVTSGFVIKPLYMLLSAVMIFLLWRYNTHDLSLLRWGLICFLIGETFCAVNYIFFNEQSEGVEYLHGLGMILGFSFIFRALVEGLDSRVVHYSSETDKCAAVNLCRGCAKYTNVPCGLKRLFLLLTPFTIVLAGIPLAASTQPVSYNTTIFGTPYNYSHAVVQQFFEIRFAPLVAIIFLSLTFIFLAIRGSRGVQYSKVLFGIGVSYLGFGLLRLIMLAIFSSNMVWFVFWEEATELLLMLAILAVLYIFRGSLLTANRQKTKGNNIAKSNA